MTSAGASSATSTCCSSRPTRTLTPAQFFGDLRRDGRRRAWSCRCSPDCIPASCCRWALMLAIVAAGAGCCCAAAGGFEDIRRQLPDALEMIARALARRAEPGVGLQPGRRGDARRRSARNSAACSRSRTWASRWRQRCDNMTERIPNLDLRVLRHGRDPAAADGRRPGRNPRQDRRPDPRAIPDLGTGAGADRRRPAVGRRAAGLAAGAVRGRLPPESRLRHAAVHRSDGPARCWPAPSSCRCSGRW